MSDAVCRFCGGTNPAGSAYCGFCSRPLADGPPGPNADADVAREPGPGPGPAAWPEGAPPPVPGPSPQPPSVQYAPAGVQGPDAGPVTCAVCGYVLGALDATCARCKTPRGMRVDPDAAVPGTYAPTAAGWSGSIGSFPNTSGQRTRVPPELAGGFNFGGCTLGCIWAFAMGLPAWGAAALISSLCCGLANLPIGLILAIKGNEWAWQNRRFDSIEHFRMVQRKWATWGIVVTVLVILFYVAYYAVIIVMGLTGNLD